MTQRLSDPNRHNQGGGDSGERTDDQLLPASVARQQAMTQNQTAAWCLGR
jgi:hypothetical protein